MHPFTKQNHQSLRAKIAAVYATIRIYVFMIVAQEKYRVPLRLLTLLIFFVSIAVFGSVASAQAPSPTPVPKIASPTPASTPPVASQQKGDAKSFTPEQVAETVLFFYAFPNGRATLNQIRKTTLERGVANITNAEGKVERVPYQRFIIRGENLMKERIRLDQEFPSARYSLVFASEKTFGIYNNTVFTPREDAAKVFENHFFHGVEALLRYKENESKLEMAEKEKVMGVDYFVIDVTDKHERKTRFYISAKSFRVMMLTYDENGVKYKRKFYDYNYAQGTLVPFRTVLWAGEKIIEETEIGTITFGQKVDEELFKAG